MSAIRRGQGRGESRWLLFLVLGFAALMLGAGAFAAPRAAAEEGLDPLKGIECKGKVKPEKDSIFPNAYAYEFGCNEDIFAFSIVSNREIDSFSTEIIGLTKKGEPAENEDFFCVGALPAFGFGCYGRPGRDPVVRISARNRAIGEFTLSRRICAANEQPRFWGVAMAEFSTVNDLDPENPRIRKWMATSEPFPINSKAVRCKVLNPQAKARQMCARARKAKGPKAKASLRAKCKKLQAAARG